MALRLKGVLNSLEKLASPQNMVHYPRKMLSSSLRVNLRVCVTCSKIALLPAVLKMTLRVIWGIETEMEEKGRKVLRQRCSVLCETSYQGKIRNCLPPVDL